MWVPVVQVTVLLITVAGLVLGRRLAAGSPQIRRRLGWGLRPVVGMWVLGGLVALSYTIPSLVGLRFCPGAMGKILGFAALLTLPVWWLPQRALGWGSGAWLFLLTIFGFADVIYGRHQGNFVPVAALWGVGQTWAIRASVASWVRPVDGWLLLTVAAAVAAALFLPSGRAASRSWPSWSWRWRVGATLVVVVPAAGLIAHNLHHRRVQRVVSHERLACDLGLYGAHVMDTARRLETWWRQSPPTTAQLAQVQAYYQRQAAGPAHGVAGGTTCNSVRGSIRGANLLLIQVEALQSWIVDSRVGDQAVMPFLHRLPSEAVSVPHVLDQTGESNTADTEYVVLNSLHPLREGAVPFRFPDHDFVTLPEVLADHGYVSLSAHPWERGFWNRAVVHPRYGFSRSLFRRELGGIIDQIGWGSSDAAFYRQMVPILADLSQPYFAFLVTLMSHHPYTFFPPERRILDLGPLEETQIGAYVHLMHAVDTALQQFVSTLAEQGLLANTVLVIYGDHDARLQIPADQLTAIQQVLGLTKQTAQWLQARDPRVDFVPLFFRWPGGAPNGTRDIPFGLIDLAPTLLLMQGIPPPPAFLGQPRCLDGSGWVARMDGTVMSADRVFLPRGRQVPAPGLCWEWASHRALPRAACGDLIELGNEQVGISEMVTILDLASRITPPSGVPISRHGP